jgi:hypothetical protein
MSINLKQIELAHSVPLIVGLLPSKRQVLVLNTGKAVAAVIANAGLTIREQAAAMAIADLYLQFCHEDKDNQKWSDLMEAAIRRNDV